MRTLQGVGVLVTRPEHQASQLCELLEAQGAVAVPFAVIRIEPIVDDPASRLDLLASFDLIIFTSVNAVAFGMRLLESSLDGPGNPKLAAMGPATARALQQKGLKAIVTATGGFDSERLLLHPELQGTFGRRILIIKGVGGRKVLQEELELRGARVQVAEVYRRERAPHSPEELAALEARFAAGTIQAITATSAEIAAALIESASPPLQCAFSGAHWVVPSARVAAAVRERGIAAPLLRADSADDHDLVAAIARWRSSVSGA